MIHRDVKLSNVFISSNGWLKLGDFGIAKVLDAEQSCARTFVGTPTYLSPEILQEKAYSSKTDVWAAGCLLYELCALVKPFQGHSFSAVCVKVSYRGIQFLKMTPVGFLKGYHVCSRHRCCPPPPCRSFGAWCRPCRPGSPLPCTLS